MVGWGDAVPGWMFDKLIMVNVIPTPTVVVRKVCLDRAGLFDKSFSYCEDWDLWLRVALHYDVAFVPQALAGATVYGDVPSRLAAYESEMSQIGILEKVFSNLPERMSHLAPLKPLAVARRHLAAACRDYSLNRVPRAREHLVKAMSLDETLLHQADRFLGAVVDQGFHFAGPSGTCEDVFPLIERVFSNLPPLAERYTEMKFKARARVYIVDAFRSYEVGDLTRARRDILRGVLRDPSWLTNRGVISILLKSIVGKKPQEQFEGSRGWATAHRIGLEQVVNQ
jgi:hypothetical protein